MENPTRSNTIQQLSPRQQEAIALLLEGKTDSEVGLAIGVTRNTVCQWRNRDPAFIKAKDEIKALQEHRAQIQKASKEKFRSLVTQSFRVLTQNVAQGNLNAAIAVLLLKSLGIEKTLADMAFPGVEYLEQIEACTDKEGLEPQVNTVTEIFGVTNQTQALAALLKVCQSKEDSDIADAS